MARSLPAAPAGRTLLLWRPAMLAGLAAGACFLVLQTLWFGYAGAGAVESWRMVAALAMGPGVLDGSGFAPLVLVTAVLVHFGLSMTYALALALLLYRWHTGARAWSPPLAALIGAVYGWLLYLLNVHAFTDAFAWFVLWRGPVSGLNHAVFGAVAAAVYVRLAAPYRGIGR